MKLEVPDLFAAAGCEPEPNDTERLDPEHEFPDLEAAERERFHDILAKAINDAWEAGLRFGDILDAVSAARRYLQYSLIYAEDDDVAELTCLIERDDIERVLRNG